MGSIYKQWLNNGTEPQGSSLEHCYAGSRHIQNYDGSSSYGARWHWAGAQNDHGAPLRAPSADSSAQQTYYTPSAGGAGDPQRRSFVIGGTSEGDQRLLYAQGRPMAKDSSGSGSNWAVGTSSAIQSQFQTPVESRFFFTGTVTGTDMSRATDKREKDRLGIFGTSNSYAGSYGRVTSEPIGRDLNPLGRGSGQAFVAGAINLGRITSQLAGSRSVSGTGNSINNCGQFGCGFGLEFGYPLYEPLFPTPDIQYPSLIYTGEFDESRCNWFLLKKPNIPSGPFGQGAGFPVSGNYDPFLPPHPIPNPNVSGYSGPGGNMPLSDERCKPQEMDSPENTPDDDECTPEILAKRDKCFEQARYEQSMAQFDLYLYVTQEVQRRAALIALLMTAAGAWPNWMFRGGAAIFGLGLEWLWSRNRGQQFWTSLLTHAYQIGNTVVFEICKLFAEIASLYWWYIMKGCGIKNDWVQDMNVCCLQYRACCKKFAAYWDCENCISDDPYNDLITQCYSKYGYSAVYGGYKQNGQWIW